MRGWLLAVVLCGCGCSAVSPGNQGARAYRAGRFEEALRLWKPLAEKSDVRAQCQLAYLYERGLGVPQDLPQAIAWYEKAAAQQSGYAENSLGQLYARDQPEKSLHFHLLAAGHGELASQLASARLLAGKGQHQPLSSGIRRPLSRIPLRPGWSWLVATLTAGELAKT